MVRLNIIVEGQSEETFVRDILTPFLADVEVYVSVRCVETRRHRHVIYRGGLENYQKLHDDLLRWSREDPNAWFTTMIDMYALPQNFPDYHECQMISDPYMKVEELEKSFGCNIGFRRFIPYIQLHEFEALLLCDPFKLSEYYIGTENVIHDLHKVCSQYDSPELINEGSETAPSKRILRVIPEYDKVAAGTLVAAEIGLPLMRERCPHFAQWLQRLESLTGECTP